MNGYDRTCCQPISEEKIHDQEQPEAHFPTTTQLLPPFEYTKTRFVATVCSMSKYESIPAATLDVEQNDDQIGISIGSEQQHRKLPRYRKVGLVIGALMLLSFAIVIRNTGAHATTGGRISLLGASNPDGGVSDGGEETPAPCTFSECYASNCNWDLAPYTCLLWNGGPHGGCSQVPWIEGTCTTQCDLSGCSDVPIPDEQDSCDVPCDDEAWCKQQSSRLCGSDVPFQCTTGASTFGCSDDKLTWTLRSSSASCSACCNVKSCA